MTLKEIREELRKVTGRYDLVTAAGADSGMDRYIKAAHRFLERQVETLEAKSLLMQTLTRGENVIKLDKLISLVEVWYSEDAKQFVPLDRISFKALQTDYPDFVQSAVGEGSFIAVPGTPDTFTRTTGSFLADGFTIGMLLIITDSTSNDSDSVYTVASVAATTLTLSTTTTLTGETSNATIVGYIGTLGSPVIYTNSIGRYVKDTSQQSYTGVSFYPPITKTTYFRVEGRFEQPLTSDDSTSFWTENFEDALIAATGLKIEGELRNTEGFKDWQNVLSVYLPDIGEDNTTSMLDNFNSMKVSF